MKKILTTALFITLAGILSINAQNRIYTPTLLSPADKAFAQPPNVVLDWSAVTGGNTGIITYELYFDTDPEFSSPEIYTTEFVSGYQMSELMFGQTYYWKVRAKDGAEVSGWSDTFSFDVIRRMVTNRPADADDELAPSVTFEWTAVTGITEYDYQLDTIGFWDLMEAPVSVNLEDAFTVDEMHSWIVGEDGAILFYDGTTLVEQESGTSDDLKSVFFLDASNGWAVGKGGIILYYNGTEWAEQASSTTKDLNSVFFLDASNGYAVGKDGVVIHYDGTAWASAGFTASKDLYEVFFVDANTGWAVGKSATIVHYNGTEWVTQTSPVPLDLYSVAFVDANKGFAGGKSGTFLTYSNGEWQKYGVFITSKDINDLSISGNSGWAAGKTGTLMEFDGSEWFLSTGATQETLLGIGFSNNTGFAVGEDGFVYKFNPAAFTSPLAEVIHHVPNTQVSATVHDLNFGTTYFWRMRTKHSQDISAWSGARSFTTLFTVTLDKPNNNSTGQNLDVELKWKVVTNGVTYEIEVDEDQNFGSPISLESEDITIHAEMLTFNTPYFWRVRAVHAFDASEWSNPFKFTTVSTVTLASPLNNATDVKLVPLLSWNALTGIGGYQVQLASDMNFETILVDQKLEPENASLAIPIYLEKNTQYYWRARAFKSLDTTAWSAEWTFLTIGEVGISEPGDIPGLSLYPNPASNNLFIQMERLTDEVMQIRISDLLGRPVLEREINFASSGKLQAIDVSALSKGIYMMQISSGSKVMTRKLIIAR